MFEFFYVKQFTIEIEFGSLWYAASLPPIASSS